MMTRILYSDNGVLTDLSSKLDDYNSGSETLTINAAQDAIFIGAYYPFNSKFFKITDRVDDPDALPAPIVYDPMNPTIEYWTGSNGWESAVEIIDETNGFKNSGFLSFVPNKNNSWSREDSTEIPELLGKTIYDLFWMKLTFSDDGDLELKWIGELFSNDNDLGSEFPDLLRSQTLDSFKTGKTSWEEQHIIAAKVLVDDLKSRKIISFKEQILDRKEFTLASVQKCASLIYNSFGDDFLEQKKECENEYSKRIKKDVYNVDKNETAVVDVKNLTARQGMFYR